MREYTQEIHETVQKYAHTFYVPGQTPDDLSQEGFFVFLRASDKYDKTKGTSFKTFFTALLINHYKNMIRAALSRPSVGRNDEIEAHCDPSQISCYYDKNPMELIETLNLDKESKLLCSKIIDQSTALHAQLTAPDNNKTSLKQTIRNYLKNNMLCRPWRVRAIFHSISSALQEV